MRISRQTHSRVGGFSLIESIIVMGVMMVILVAAQMFASSGVNFYRNSVQALEVQQATLVGITNMAQELGNSHLEPIVVLPAPANDSIVFPSPAKMDGSLENSDEGVILWHTIVCYALRTLPDGKRVIERKAEPHVPPVDYPPDPLNIGGSAHDAAYFAGVPAVGVIARYIAPPDAADPPFAIVKGPDSLTITLKVEFSQTTRDTMKVETKVFPRN